ncbi:MAG: hypothetical protein WCV58_00345 [Patescibacteria group bacterium]
MKKAGFLSVVLVVFLSLVVAFAANAAQLYNAIDLGFNPRAINNQGVVGGTRLVINDDSSFFEAVTWKKGVITSLGTFGGGAAGVCDINDRGTLLINVDPGNGAMGDWTYLVIQPNGQQDEIKGMVGEDYVYLLRLNNLNQAVGYLSSRTGSQKGFIWSQQAQITIKMDGRCWLEAINDAGQAVGYGSQDIYSAPSPMIWTNSSMWALDTPSGTGGVHDINNSGWSVGSYGTSDSSAFHPAFWTDDGCLLKLKDLGGLPGFAAKINKRGEIIGFLDGKPAIWQTPKAKPIFLSDVVKNLKILDTMDINDLGQIITEAERPNGTHGYFLLTRRNR